VSLGPIFFHLSPSHQERRSKIFRMARHSAKRCMSFKGCFNKHHFEPLAQNSVRVAHRPIFNFPGMCSYHQTVRNSSDMRFTPSSMHSGELVQNLKGGPSILRGFLQPTFYISSFKNGSWATMETAYICAKWDVWLTNAVGKLEWSALDLQYNLNSYSGLLTSDTT